MRVVTTFADARAAFRRPVGLVPTMGFLHEGHLSHVAAARARDATVVMSLFVNPLQFGEGEDLARYPRDLARDEELAAGVGVDVLFAPSLEEMYPAPPVTRVLVPGLVDRMEGAARPGHFAGVATVVAKLLAGLAPDRAYFGRKDAQQLSVVRRMVGDLSFPVEIVAGPTVRHADGLALSSRNAYLAATERRAALSLSRGLMHAADAAEAGERDARVLEETAFAQMAREPGVEPEYVELASALDADRLDRLDQTSFLAAAIRVGAVRLIDNVWFDVGDAGVAVDRGVRLSGASVLEAPSALEGIR